MDKGFLVKGSKVKDFIEGMLKQITAGAGSDFSLIGKSIDFELNVTDASKKEGGLDLRVIHVGADTRSETIQKVKFQLTPTDSVKYLEQEKVKEFIKEKPNAALRRYLKG